MLNILLKCYKDLYIRKALIYIHMLKNKNIEKRLIEILPIRITSIQDFYWLDLEYKRKTEEIVLGAYNIVRCSNNKEMKYNLKYDAWLIPNYESWKFVNYYNLHVDDLIGLYKMERSRRQPTIIKGREFVENKIDFNTTIVDKFNGNYYLYKPDVEYLMTKLSKAFINKFKLNNRDLLIVYSKVFDIGVELYMEVNLKYVFEALLINYIVNNFNVENTILSKINDNYIDRFMKGKMYFEQLVKFY